MSRPWTDRERSYVRAAMGHRPVAEIAADLDRSTKSVERYIERVRHPRPRRVRAIAGGHRLWTTAEDYRLMCWTGRKCPAEMAALLGRSELAVRKRCARLRLCPTREGGLTSTQAAKIAGYSPQWLTHLARTGQVKARRVPGGRWWLFPVEGLPVREGAR